MKKKKYNISKKLKVKTQFDLYNIIILLYSKRVGIKTTGS